MGIRCSREAAKQLGYKPYPQPSGNLSQAYTNPLGVKLGQCTFCGFCEWFGCANYSKASPQTTILPVLLRKSNFEARTECEVTRINLDRAGKWATGVTYVDTSGDEWEQPADLVLLCAFQLFNVQLLLLSGIGTPYDPQSGKGQIGRNFTHQTVVDRGRLLRQGQIQLQSVRRLRLRSACASTSSTATISITATLGFVGGGYIGQVPHQRPPARKHGGAARHAGLGREMETGAARQLSELGHLRAPRVTARSTAIATSISISIRPTRTASAGR